MKRTITKRAVLYVGFKCNAKCEFCYYRYTEGKKWRNLKEVIKEALRFRYFYKNQFVDITGGEPSIYPHIMDLVRYCSHIGLEPTIITNMLVLADIKKCLEFKKSGIHDFLVSIFGLGKTADKITGVSDTYKKQETALNNLVKLKIPFRINVTVHKLTTKQLPDIARLSVEKGAKIMNMIVFNPFLKWQDKVNIKFQERYSNMFPYIKKAIEILERNAVEANVRYFPLCMLKGFEKNNYNFMQLSYDPHEWDFNSWGDYFIKNPTENWYKKEALRKRFLDCDYQKSEKCRRCSVNYICDGFHKQYKDRFGFGEEDPYILNEKITVPTYFIKNREKLRYEYENKKNSILLNYFLKDPLFLRNIIQGKVRLIKRKFAFRQYIKRNL